MRRSRRFSSWETSASIQRPKIIDHLKERVAEEHITDPAECKQLLIESIKNKMDVGDTAYEFENRKSVVLVIGVNGVGKRPPSESWPAF